MDRIVVLVLALALLISGALSGDWAPLTGLSVDTTGGELPEHCAVIDPDGKCGGVVGG